MGWLRICRGMKTLLTTGREGAQGRDTQSSFLQALLTGPSNLETDCQGSMWPCFTQAASSAQRRAGHGGGEWVGTSWESLARELRDWLRFQLSVDQYVYADLWISLSVLLGFIMILLIPRGWDSTKQQWEPGLPAQMGLGWEEEGATPSSTVCCVLGFLSKGSCVSGTWTFFFPKRRQGLNDWWNRKDKFGDCMFPTCLLFCPVNNISSVKLELLSQVCGPDLSRHRRLPWRKPSLLPAYFDQFSPPMQSKHTDSKRILSPWLCFLSHWAAQSATGFAPGLSSD